MITESSLQTLPTGLRLDVSGTIRVGPSRVTFELVIGAWLGGATPEEIAARFPSADLPDVYGAIAWYLRAPAEASEYLEQRLALSEDNLREVQRRFTAAALKAQLLARRGDREWARF